MWRISTDTKTTSSNVSLTSLIKKPLILNCPLTSSWCGTPAWPKRLGCVSNVKLDSNRPFLASLRSSESVKSSYLKRSSIQLIDYVIRWFTKCVMLPLGSCRGSVMGMGPFGKLGQKRPWRPFPNSRSSPDVIPTPFGLNSLMFAQSVVKELVDIPNRSMWTSKTVDSAEVISAWSIIIRQNPKPEINSPHSYRTIIKTNGNREWLMLRSWDYWAGNLQSRNWLLNNLMITTLWWFCWYSLYILISNEIALHDMSALLLN